LVSLFWGVQASEGGDVSYMLAELFMAGFPEKLLWNQTTVLYRSPGYSLFSITIKNITLYKFCRLKKGMGSKQISCHI